jgi:hypothetical protein
MKRTALILALLASTSVFAGGQMGQPGGMAITGAQAGYTGTVPTATAVTLPATVIADRTAVSADLAAVAIARAKLVTDVVAKAATALVDADSAAFKAARMQLESDMYKLRTDAQPIVTADEATLSLDRIMLEIYGITSNTTAYTAALTQFNTDRAQADANQEAIFGSLCPTGTICVDGSGHGGNGPQHGR